MTNTIQRVLVVDEKNNAAMTMTMKTKDGIRQRTFFSTTVVVVLMILLFSTIALIVLSSESLLRTTIMTIDSIEDYIYIHYVEDTEGIQDHRQLRQRPICVNTNANFWETYVVRRRFALNFYIRRGGILGSCGDVCDDACNHSPCYEDYNIGTNGYTCTCFTQNEAQSLCKDNTYCDETVDECRCNPQYEGDPSIGCTDIDECKANICGTSISTIGCTNQPGSYSCSCRPNYVWDGSYGTGCRDVNECTELGTNPCGGINSICTNTPGSYSCFCKTGYTGIPPAKPCTDVNECTTADKCGQFGTCTNTEGGYQCNCRTGFVWPTNTSICVDVNECTGTTKPCTGANQICVNTIGSFGCVCAPGYGGYPNCVEINECTVIPPVCGPNSSCTSVGGKTVCTCNPDYPGGDPPTEPCRKLFAGETCPPDTVSNVCSTGLQCGQKSRSENSTYNCCESTSRCNVNKRCCNGAYDENETCPSGADEDCKDGLVCAKRTVTSSTKICCRGFIFVPGIGNVCNSGGSPVVSPISTPVQTPTNVPTTTVITSPPSNLVVDTDSPTTPLPTTPLPTSESPTSGTTSPTDIPGTVPPTSEPSSTPSLAPSEFVPCTTQQETDCGLNSSCRGTQSGEFLCTCDADFPGGDPPTDPCRKLIAGETCPANVTTSNVCSTGLECAQVSRSDTNYNCCSSVSTCFTTKRCCNGAYGQGEGCPSGVDEDCEDGLSCARRSILLSEKICCQNIISVPLLGIVCDRLS